MTNPTRRELLAATGATVAASLSGCLDAVGSYLGADEEGELVVALTNIRRPTPDGAGPGTPEDIVARIDIENRIPERVSGRLEMELRYVPNGETEQRWNKTDELEYVRGISPQPLYVFESAYQPGSQIPGDYELDAEIVNVQVIKS
ncbi:hypothetical protein [Halovenus halobia]|uniref:hypothetical protein n=1 Tax=Halovenus halobia TaxID=3396622 RepID=UPI003F56AD53